VHYFTATAQSAGLQCIDCHMPDVINVNGTTLRGALHTHRFESMRPETSIKYGPNDQANSCTYRCHQDKGADKTERAQWAASYLQSHLEFAAAGGNPSVRLTGLRNFLYAVEGSTDLLNWSGIVTNRADATGVLTVPTPIEGARPVLPRGREVVRPDVTSPRDPAASRDGVFVFPQRDAAAAATTRGGGVGWDFRRTKKG
jgi:hypothetical protein